MPMVQRASLNHLVVLQVWYSSRQEVPYTGRKHSVLVSSDMEQELGWRHSSR